MTEKIKLSDKNKALVLNDFRTSLYRLQSAYEQMTLLRLDLEPFDLDLPKLDRVVFVGDKIDEWVESTFEKEED